MKTTLPKLLACVAFALLVAGCGGGGDESAAPTPTPGADPNAQVVANPADPTAAAADAALNTAPSQGTPLPDVDGGKVSEGFGGLYGVSEIFDAKAKMVDEGESFDTYDPSTDVYGETTYNTTDYSSTTTTETTTAVTYGPATIMLDGKNYTVTKGTVFPSDTQQFKVGALTATTAVVNLTAGEFSDGSSGITLEKGKSVTLVNQSEGVTYVLKLTKVESTA